MLNKAMRFNENKPQFSYILEFPNAFCGLCHDDDVLKHVIAFVNQGDIYELNEALHVLLHSVKIEDFAKVCEMGAKKYTRGNWKKGRKYMETIDSFMRHYVSDKHGSSVDDESGLPHLAHCVWNLAAIIEWHHMGLAELDDRVTE